MIERRIVGAPKRHDAARDILRHEIEDGRYRDAAVLPGERVLAADLSISRTTLRRALAALIDEGRIEHRHGMGTFVTRPRPSATSGGETSGPTPFAPWTTADGARLIETGMRRAKPDEILILGMSPAELVSFERRVLLEADMPSAVEHVIVPRRYLSETEGETRLLFTALVAGGFRPVRTLERILGTKLDGSHATLLGVAPPCPGVLIESAAYLGDGRCCALTRTLHRLDRADAVFEREVSSYTARG